MVPGGKWRLAKKEDGGSFADYEEWHAAGRPEPPEGAGTSIVRPSPVLTAMNAPLKPPGLSLTAPLTIDVT
jgi:hypothetical protein